MRHDSMKNFFSQAKKNITDDRYRFRFQLCSLYFILGIVSVIMTIINGFTQLNALFYSTLSFGVFCCVMFFITFYLKVPKILSEILFCLSIYALFTFFIVSGIPEGFSAIWICLLPACGMLLFGKKDGSLMCLGMLLIIIFFFQIPCGKSLLQWEYTQSFCMRFPILYIAFYFVCFFFESVRAATQEKLLKAQHKYRYLYTHDALTKVYNRYGFDEFMKKAIKSKKPFLFFMMDIDNFKNINDEYGHLAGDYVLQFVAKLIKNACEGAYVSRWGGEEFTVIWEKEIKERTNFKCADKLRKQIENTSIYYSGKEINVTVSIGAVSVMKTDIQESNKIIGMADDCLYQAKNKGKNCVICNELN